MQIIPIPLQKENILWLIGNNIYCLFVCLIDFCCKWALNTSENHIMFLYRLYNTYSSSQMFGDTF